MKRRPSFKFLLVFIALSIVTVTTSAQYGNEWQKPYQTYFKIKTVEDGMYKLDYNALQQAGLPVNSLDPDKIQLFFKGQEQAIHITGAADNSFDLGDYIEFLGKRNDGQNDAAMYAKPEYQPHQNYSLFSDTSVYFLTWLPDTSTRTGKRFEEFYNPNYNTYTAEPFCWAEAINTPHEIYFEGVPLLPEFNFNTPEYVDGESWTSSRFGLGQEKLIAVATPELYASGPNPTAEAILFGMSDVAFVSTDHHVVISVGPNSTNYREITDIQYGGYRVQKFNYQLQPSDIGGATTFRFQVIDDLGPSVTADWNSVSMVKVTYPRQYELNNTTQLRFKNRPDSPDPFTRLSFDNYGGVAPILYDFTNQRRVRGDKVINDCELLIPNNNLSNDLYLIDSTDLKSVLSIEPVNFRFIDALENYEFLIITNRKLTTSATDYANYRSGQFKTLVMYTDELYDMFFYGFTHPLAVRNFSNYLLSESQQKPEYLLLLGKGIQTDLVRDPDKFQLNLVPSIGVPSSDVMFTNRLDGTNAAPAIPIGRIAAQTDEEVQNYLDKLVFHETNPDSIQAWRKDILHLGGGEDLAQQQRVKGVLEDYQELAEGLSLGAKTTSFNKNESGASTSNLKQNIIDEINGGIGLLTFMGHGSLNVLDIDIGQAADLTNKNQYPVMYFNGCNVGNANLIASEITSDVGIDANNYITGKDKGCLAWLAHTNVSIENLLYVQMEAFYQNAFIKNYGESIGNLLKATIEDAEAGSGSELMLSHNLQLLLQGDPALRMYSPSKPDYEITKPDLFIAPEKVSATSDSFAVAIIATNLGQATEDSVTVSIRRTFPDQSEVTYPTLKFAPVFNQDTLFYYIKSKDPKTTGRNIFKVTLDYGNQVDELNEVNNTQTLEFFMPGNGLNIISPEPYAIVSETSVSITAQANDLFTKDAEYIFELDTTPLFDNPSSVFQTSGTMTADALATWQINLPQQDSAVYYWRVRLNVPDSQGGYWVNSSFIYIKDSPKGWSQSHYYQFQNIQLDGLSLDEQSRDFIYDQIEQTVSVSSKRWSHRNLGIKTETSQFLTPFGGPCFNNIDGGIAVVLFHPKSLQQFVFTDPTYEPTCATAKQYRYYTFITITQDQRTKFQELVDHMEEGTYVAVFSRYAFQANNWDEETYQAFEELGSSLIRTINDDSTAYVLLGRKGAPIGTVLEDTLYNDVFANSIGVNHSDTILVSVEGQIFGNRPDGTMLSELIGPAKSWDHLEFAYGSNESPSNDEMFIDVIGMGTNGEDSLLYENIDVNSFQLDAIDAKEYRFIRLRAKANDFLDRTPPQLRRWQVFYEGVPEGTIAPDITYDFYNETLQQGDTLRVQLAFRNLTSTSFDSLKVRYTITDSRREEQAVAEQIVPPLGALDTVTLSQSFPTLTLADQNSLFVYVNPDAEQPELSLANNTLNIPFEVLLDKTNPLLDVTFDGRHIMNGDIVSPSPLITVTSRDENPILIQNDTAAFRIYLLRPEGNSFEEIYFGDQAIHFIPAESSNNQARIEYTPQNLVDGTYTLKVESADRSGNNSSDKPYQVDFEVINESTITHFFPYPNPFTTSMRFVYTLTGSEQPQDLKIQIMTVSGKVVREVFKDEFGPMQIGNNVSEFVWDGTDQFGDRLANGVYLYRVSARISGEQLKHRETAADRFFVQKVGKIYLMR